MRSTLLTRMSWAMPVYPDKRAVANYANLAEIPLTRIVIRPGVISYEEMDPIIASDGSPIAATGKGTWGQLYRAGRA